MKLQVTPHKHLGHAEERGAGLVKEGMPNSNIIATIWTPTFECYVVIVDLRTDTKKTHVSRRLGLRAQIVNIVWGTYITTQIG